MNGSNPFVIGRVQRLSPGNICSSGSILALALILGGSPAAWGLAISPSGRPEQACTAETEQNAESSAAPLLTGAATKDLLGDSAPTSRPSAAADDDVFVFPVGSSTRPTTIPFPTAAHLFVPGALLAMYATRRFRGRRR